MNLNYNHCYDDIINKPYFKSKHHPTMSMYARSAQFAPFAALTGYEEAVKETARETNERIDIDNELKEILDCKLQILQEYINKKPEVSFTYFVPDLKKEGGEYITEIGVVSKIDFYENIIVLANKKIIPINEIIEISGQIFNFLN